MMVGSAAAFTAPSFVGRNTALNSAVANDLYTFEKSAEIFEEAKTVSWPVFQENIVRYLESRILKLINGTLLLKKRGGNIFDYV